MKNFLLAERYARALLDSLETDELEPAVAALQAFANVYQEQHDLRSALLNPSQTLERRAAVLNALLEKMAMPPKTARLIQLLLSRGRIALAPEAAAGFERLADERIGRIGAAATTAIPMPDEARDALAAGLAQFSGKEVRLACNVDPEVVGGVVVRLDGLLLDGSLRTRLKRLTEDLLSRDIEAGPTSSE